MNKDPITQATSQHHADEAAYQRRAEALTEEIYADLPAHLDEIVEFTNCCEALKSLLTEYQIAPSLGLMKIIETAVKKIVEMRLEP